MQGPKQGYICQQVPGLDHKSPFETQPGLMGRIASVLDKEDKEERKEEIRKGGKKKTRKSLIKSN